jgi:hypothetical protein
MLVGLSAYCYSCQPTATVVSLLLQLSAYCYSCQPATTVVSLLLQLSACYSCPRRVHGLHAVSTPVCPRRVSSAASTACMLSAPSPQQPTPGLPGAGAADTGPVGRGKW